MHLLFKYTMTVIQDIVAPDDSQSDGYHQRECMCVCVGGGGMCVTLLTENTISSWQDQQNINTHEADRVLHNNDTNHVIIII